MTVGDLVVGRMHSNSVRVTDDTTGGDKISIYVSRISRHIACIMQT